MALEEGKTAPDFTLMDPNGKEISLKNYRGKNVIMYFYPRDHTPGCTKEAQGFRDRWRKIRARDTVVLGISPDSPATHRKFIQKYDLPFTLLSDPDKRVMIRYGAFGEKTMYGKKTMGVIRSTVWVDPEGRVKRHWARVTKAADHPAQVLQALEEGL